MSKPGLPPPGGHADRDEHGPDADPFAPPEAPRTPSDPGIDIPQVAVLHRRLNLLFLASLVILGMNLALTWLAGPSGKEGLFRILELVLAGGMALFFLALLVTLYQLTVSLGWSVAARVGVVAAMLVSLVNLIVILFVIVRGQRVLKEAGLRVGFLGVPPDELAAWERKQTKPRA